MDPSVSKIPTKSSPFARMPSSPASPGSWLPPIAIVPRAISAPTRATWLEKLSGNSFGIHGLISRARGGAESLLTPEGPRKLDGSLEEADRTSGRGTPIDASEIGGNGDRTQGDGTATPRVVPLPAVGGGGNQQSVAAVGPEPKVEGTMGGMSSVADSSVVPRDAPPYEPEPKAKARPRPHQEAEADKDGQEAGQYPGAKSIPDFPPKGRENPRSSSESSDSSGGSLSPSPELPQCRSGHDLKTVKLKRSNRQCDIFNARFEKWRLRCRASTASLTSAANAPPKSQAPRPPPPRRPGAQFDVQLDGRVATEEEPHNTTHDPAHGLVEDKEPL